MNTSTIIAHMKIIAKGFDEQFLMAVHLQSSKQEFSGQSEIEIPHFELVRSTRNLFEWS